MARVVLSGGPLDGQQLTNASPEPQPFLDLPTRLGPEEYHALLHGPVGNVPPDLRYRLEDEIGGVRFYEFDREVPRV